MDRCAGHELDEHSGRVKDAGVGGNSGNPRSAGECYYYRFIHKSLYRKDEECLVTAHVWQERLYNWMDDGV